ncbi:MAG: radical SAM protein, partial [Elusimicrobiota bacterium]
ELLQRTIVLKSKPLKLEIPLTDKCNLSCIMCLQRTHGKHEITGRTCREIGALIPYLETINWIGGEACLSPYFESLFDEAARYPRLRHNIITNGLFIDERWAEKLAKTRTCVCVSVDGFTAETYEYVRRGARFDDLVGALTRLQKYFPAYPVSGMPRLILNFVLMKRNCKDLEHLVDFARRFGIKTVQINPLNPFQPDSEYREQNPGADPELMQWYLNIAVPRLQREAAEKNIQVGLPDLGRIVAQTNVAALTGGGKENIPVPSSDTIDLTCPYPWGSLFSDPEGRVGPFCQCGTAFGGNVYQEGILAAWNGDVMRRYRQLAGDNDSSLGCKTCVMKHYRLAAGLCDPLW